jgi:hypothetical protein
MSQNPYTSGLKLRHLFAKNHTAQFVAQSFRLFGIAGGAKTFGKVVKRLLLLLPRFDAQLDEFYQDAVVAQTLVLGYTIHLPGKGSG